MRIPVSLVLVFAAGFAAAQGSLEIIPLRHRTVEQVLPTLRPLLEPGGVLTGQSNQLFVRTSPANLDEIRRALAAIDTPARRLVISVRFDQAGDASRREAQATGRISSGNVSIGNRPGPEGVEVRIDAANSRFDERVDQRVQVLEGGHAYIAAGGSRVLRYGQVQEIGTGFEVVPRLAGDRVMLEIAPQRESFGPRGTVQSQRLASTVSGRLGEWIELGGAALSESRDQRAVLAGESARSSDDRRIWVRVDEAR